MSVQIPHKAGRCLLAAALLLSPHIASGQSAPRLPIMQDVRPFPSAEHGWDGIGDAVVSFHIDADGKTSNVNVLSAADDLKPMAISTATYWKFPAGPPEDRTITLHVRQVDLDFDDETHGLQHTVFNAPNEATLTFTKHMTRTRSKCPETGESPVTATPAGEDYVELERTVCYGSCPAYKLRITRSGLVTWKSSAAYMNVKDAERRMSPAQAAQLLARFDSPVVHSACLNYESHWTDNPTVFLRINLAGQTKSIRDYGDAAPTAITALELAIDEAADSHQWRVGDPRSEDISMISADGWLPKPGKTPLMTAAAKGRVDEVRAELAKGADIASTDASGWTALMYGANNPKVTRVLLDAHADPNQKGPHGETALHFISSYSAKESLTTLLTAGADPNAVTTDGVTPLMRLAADANLEPIQLLLAAGAHPTARDAEGRTAMDYLIAKSCGISIRSPKPVSVSPTKNGCDALIPEALGPAKLFLEQAGAQQTRQWAPQGDFNRR